MLVKRARTAVRYVVVQGCPVPALMAPILSQLLHASGARLQSCYRGADAESMLHRLGKHSQRELYDAWLHRRAGANPANPPGFSTHELRNDGAAYTGVRRGGQLKWWQVGIDIDDAHVQAFIAAAAKRGWHVARTYPTSHAEYHHVNFRKPPLRLRVAAHVKAKRMMQLSGKGAAFIGRFEGFVAHPYNDAAGYATVGFGHLIGKRPVTPADRKKWGTLSRKRGLKLLRQDAQIAGAAVREHVKVPLTQQQFDALVSLAFNIGGGAFASSTLVRKLNAGRRQQAADEFLSWDRAGGRTLAGLSSRRRSERHLFLTGSYSG